MTLNRSKKTTFGSLACNVAIDDEFVCLRAAGILSVHCDIFVTPGNGLVLEVKKDALVCVNGQRIIDNTRKLRNEDHILLGQAALFIVHLNGFPRKDTKCDSKVKSYQQYFCKKVLWDMGRSYTMSSL